MFCIFGICRIVDIYYWIIYQRDCLGLGLQGIETYLKMNMLSRWADSLKDQVTKTKNANPAIIKKKKKRCIIVKLLPKTLKQKKNYPQYLQMTVFSYFSMFHVSAIPFTYFKSLCLLNDLKIFFPQKLFQNSSIIYSQQNSRFLFLSLLYKLTFSENCPIYFMTKYFNIFNVFLLNFYKIKFYNSYC